MKTFLPTPFTHRFFCLLVLYPAAMLVGLQGAKGAVVPINNPGFSTGTGGEIPSQFVLFNATVAPAQQIGTTGWYGLANVANTGLAGFRPGVEVNFDASSAGVGEIRYDLAASLGGLLGLEMPEADLWQPLIGQSLLANSTYTFSIDVDAGAILDINALSNRGFGIGITTGASASSVGTFFADSLSNPSFLSITALGGTAQRLSLTFNTGASPTAGTLGVAIFAGRGTQTLQVSLLSDFDVDNASLQVVPEPRTTALFGIAVLMLLKGRRLLRLVRA